MNIKKLFDKTFLKFILVGIANTVFGMAIMFILYNAFGVNYWISSAANYVCGSILSYFLNKYFTFQNKEKSLAVIVRFVVNITICYFIAYGVAKPFVRFIFSGAGTKIQDNMAMLAGAGLFMILNYFGQRFFAFKEK
ncbi:MAG: GtrA family protein [Lachnospiraceae bacterium]|nr:GtrA family protein [Lachnospiraceae bacterium]